MNVAEDLKSFNQEKCNQRFTTFKVAHDEEVERLGHKKNLSSIGIRSCY